MLTLNVQSVLTQTDRDVEQIFIVDYDQVGVLVANKSLALNKHRVEGDYVYILDDDTRLLNKRFVARLKPVVESSPDVIMVKSSRPQFAPHVLPKPHVWNCPDRLALGSTNCLCYVVRRQMWMDYIKAFGEPAAGDWWFLKRLKSRGATFAWIDLIVAETQQLGRGRLFEKCGRDWFQQIAQELELTEVEPNDWRLLPHAKPQRRKAKSSLKKVEVKEAKSRVAVKRLLLPKVDRPKLPVPRREVPIVKRQPEPALSVPAHSLLSRRRRG